MTGDIVDSSEFYRNTCVHLVNLEVSRDLTAGTWPEIQSYLKSYSDCCVVVGGGFLGGWFFFFPPRSNSD